MTSVITEAGSIGAVIEIINLSGNGETFLYYGGTDAQEPEALAGLYAWESAYDSGETDNASIEAHLELIYDLGAKFDFGVALENAISRKK